MEPTNGTLPIPGTPVTNDIAPERTKFQRIVAKVWKVTRYILKVLVGVALLIASPAFTILGLGFGFFIPKYAKDIVDRITEVWHKVPWACVIVGGLATFIALPVVIAVASTLYGTYVGLRTSEYINKMPDDRPIPTPPPNGNPVTETLDAQTSLNSLV
ncbi:MAG: hypothetical protein VX777_10210 [Chlamydiota bacterium]|nr:hypothetical protein [Chlamydiota bacterium]